MLWRREISFARFCVFVEPIVITTTLAEITSAPTTAATTTEQFQTDPLETQGKPTDYKPTYMFIIIL